MAMNTEQTEVERMDYIDSERRPQRDLRFCQTNLSADGEQPNLTNTLVRTPEQRADELLQHLIEGRYQFPVDVGPARRAFLERVESLRHVDREPCHRCGHADWFVPEHRAYKVCKVCRSTEMLSR